MTLRVACRDYGLLGPEGSKAVELGLAGAVWYSPPISRKRLGELMKKRDGPALRDTAIWLGLLILSGAAGIWLWGSWLAVFPFATGTSPVSDGPLPCVTAAALAGEAVLSASPYQPAGRLSRNHSDTVAAGTGA